MLKKSLLLSFVLFLIFYSTGYSADTTHIFIASWNVENLFDTVDDPGKNDYEFLPGSNKKWTPERLSIKLQKLAKVIQFMNDGNGPDILGVVEVEHEWLLKRLCRDHLKSRNYKTAYLESPDRRGIDNGLIYDSDKFEVVSINPIEVSLDSGYPTRYILHVVLKHHSEMLHVFVNHWPSRRGGKAKSEKNRFKAATTLSYSIDETESENGSRNILVMGDFNDTPSDNSISQALDSFEYLDSIGELPRGYNRLLNLAADLSRLKTGTYYFRGRWDMLDQIMVTADMILPGGFEYVRQSFSVIKPIFIVQQSGEYKGAPDRTYAGNNYLGGYSDHFPVSAEFIFVEN